MLYHDVMAMHCYRVFFNILSIGVFMYNIYMSMNTVKAANMLSIS